MKISNCTAENIDKNVCCMGQVFVNEKQRRRVQQISGSRNRQRKNKSHISMYKKQSDRILRNITIMDMPEQSS